MYSLKLELKLNNKERSFMNQCAGYARFVYNYGLNMVKGTASMTKVNKQGQQVSFSYNDRILQAKKVFTNYVKKQPESALTNKYSSRIYQNAFRYLSLAFKRYKEGTSKHPRFKRKKDRQSFTVDSSNGVVMVASGNQIKIPTLGKFRLKEPVRLTTASQTFTLTKTGEKWFVSFAINAEHLPVHPLLDSRPLEVFGIDLGVKQFATIAAIEEKKISQSDIATLPLRVKEEQQKLAKFQWRNRNKQFGGKGKRTSKKAIKSYRKLARRHERIANIRRDFREKTTSTLARVAKHICLEKLNVKAMMQHGTLAASIAPQGLYEFRQRLTIKIVASGGSVVLADQWFPSSKTCHNGGRIHKELKLSERIFECPNCGTKIDRDLNAALVLSQYGFINQKARVGYTRNYACGLEGADPLD